MAKHFTAPVVTRKEIAQALNCTPRMVKANEKRWGLDAARADMNCRQVRYSSAKAEAIFRAGGWIS